MNAPAPRLSLVRALVGNALSLSAFYLACAVTFELLRRFSSFRWADQAVLAMESLPARVLGWLGVLTQLRELYVYGRIDELVLRLIFGATTVVIIFLMALGVGLVMGGLRRLATR